jgi:hypothetical protein
MIDFAAAVPAGNNVARNDKATIVARQRLTIAIARRALRFSFKSGLIDPELWQAL